MIDNDCSQEQADKQSIRVLFISDLCCPPNRILHRNSDPEWWITSLWAQDRQARAALLVFRAFELEISTCLSRARYNIDLALVRLKWWKTVLDRDHSRSDSSSDFNTPLSSVLAQLTSDSPIATQSLRGIVDVHERIVQRGPQPGTLEALDSEAALSTGKLLLAVGESLSNE